MYLIFILLFGITNLANAQVDSLWSRTYGGPSNDAFSSVIELPSGDFVLVGYSAYPPYSDSNAWLMRTRSDGSIRWSFQYGTYFSESARDLVRTTDGGFVFVGQVHESRYPTSTVLTSPWLAKADSTGHEVWRKTYRFDHNGVGRVVHQLADGRILLTGAAQFSTSSFEGWDGWVAWIDANGDTLQTRTFGDSTQNEFMDGLPTADGGLILAGFTRVAAIDRTNAWIVKTDSNGETQWSRSIRVAENQGFANVVEHPGGGFLAAGTVYRYESNSNHADFWLVRFDVNGDTLWTRTYGRHNGEYCWRMRSMSDGGYLLMGSTYSFDPIYPGIAHGWILRTSSQGDSLWSHTFDDIIFGGCETADHGYMLATASDFESAGGLDARMVRLSPPTFINNPAPAIETAFTLSQNYPNPFNATTTISFDLPHESHVLLNVFDLTGRSVATLANDVLPSGAHHVNFNAANLPSGIYVYRLTTGANSQSRKLVLLK